MKNDNVENAMTSRSKEAGLSELAEWFFRVCFSLFGGEQEGTDLQTLIKIWDTAF